MSENSSYRLDDATRRQLTMLKLSASAAAGATIGWNVLFAAVATVCEKNMDALNAEVKIIKNLKR